MNSEPKAYARYGFNSSSRESNAKDPVTDQPNIFPSPCPLPKEREKQRATLHCTRLLRQCSLSLEGEGLETPVLQNKLLLLPLGRQTGGEGDDGPGGAPVGGGFLDGLFLFAVVPRTGQEPSLAWVRSRNSRARAAALDSGDSPARCRA